MALHSRGRGHLSRSITLAAMPCGLFSAGSSVRVSGSLRLSGGRLKKNIRLIRVDQVHGVSFKKRAPRAIKEIKGFAEKAMVCWHL
jgi:hypothetical protein